MCINEEYLMLISDAFRAEMTDGSSVAAAESALKSDEARKRKGCEMRVHCAEYSVFTSYRYNVKVYLICLSVFSYE